MRDSNNPKKPGGFLENKIRKMRAQDGVVRKRRRVHSLIERRAFEGEIIEVTVTLKNPLHFPMFVGHMTPVVTFDGEFCAAPRSDHIGRDDFVKNDFENGDLVNGHTAGREHEIPDENMNGHRTEHDKEYVFSLVEFLMKDDCGF